MYHLRLRAAGSSSIYHCISRTIGGRRLWDAQARDTMRRLLDKVAGFCGVEILTYAFMSNHFHLLVRVPSPRDLSNEELVERLECLYGRNAASIEHLVKALRDQGGPSDVIRNRLLRRMHDVSFFMKELKQRFSIWYNRRHAHFGTTWAERFRCVLVQDVPAVLTQVAAYIDLNPLRAGLCRHPREYRWSGYAEALRGRRLAQRGLMGVVRAKSWAEARTRYEAVIQERGRAQVKARPHATIGDAEAPPCGRISSLSNGLAVGTADFIRRVLGSVGKNASGNGYPPLLPTALGGDIPIHAARKCH